MDTAGFKLNHSMLRVKDPTRSLDFYQNTMGATLIETFVFDHMGFTLYFLGFDAGLVGRCSARAVNMHQPALEVEHQPA